MKSLKARVEPQDESFNFAFMFFAKIIVIAFGLQESDLISCAKNSLVVKY